MAASLGLSRAAFVALAGAALLRPTAAPAATTLRAASAADDDVTPFLYAQKSGLFSKAGIDATVQSMRSGSAVAAGVIGGTFDVGKSSVMSLLNARGRGGVPIVIIAPAGVYDAASPVSGLIVKVDGPIKSAADLNGKIVAVSALNDLYTISTKAWVDAHGGDSSTLKLIELPISAVPEAIAQGRIDAGNVLEPELTFASEGGKTRVLGHPFDAIARRFVFSAWFTTAENATKNREAIEKFVVALRDAATYTNAHHSDTVPLLADFTKVDPAVIRKSTRSTAGTTLDAKEVQHLIDLAVKYKALATTFDARDIIAGAGRG